MAGKTRPNPTYNAVQFMSTGKDIDPLGCVPWPALGVQKTLRNGVIFLERDEVVPRLDIFVIPCSILDGPIHTVVDGMVDNFRRNIATEMSLIKGVQHFVRTTRAEKRRTILRGYLIQELPGVEGLSVNQESVQSH